MGTEESENSIVVSAMEAQYNDSIVDAGKMIKNEKAKGKGGVSSLRKSLVSDRDSFRSDRNS